MAKKDGLLAHCLARAVIADAGGLDAAKDKYGEKGEKARALSAWKQLKLGTKVSPRAARVAGFIILWAWAMKAEGRDSFSITEYQRYYNEGERQAYRLQSDFRELFPEFETPDVLARQIVKQLDKKPGPGSLPLSVPVTV